MLDVVIILQSENYVKANIWYCKYSVSYYNKYKFKNDEEKKGGIDTGDKYEIVNLTERQNEQKMQFLNFILCSRVHLITNTKNKKKGG